MAAVPAATPLRRDPSAGMLAGVCAGLAARTGVDVLILRVAFVAATVAGGAGIAAYLFAWILVPRQVGAVRARRLRTGRGAAEIAVGVGLLLLSALLTLRATGVWFSDAVAWPLVLVAAGGALLWRSAASGTVTAEPPPAPAPPPVPVPAPTASASGPAPAVARLTAAAGSIRIGGRPLAELTAAAPVELGRRAGRATRAAIGAALVIAAGVAFLQATGAFGAARDVALAAIAVVVVLGVLFAPYITGLVRSLGTERAARIRSQERAEVAAHLHDSVLQTLALVQRRAEDPRTVAALARTQERELRAWLAGREAGPEDPSTLRAALEAAAGEVEQAFGVEIEVVAVGDAPLDPRADALVAASREALVNAAKFAGEHPIDLYAEAADGRLAVFVRDRGPGFDPERIPADRRGVRESIRGRMDRHGGTATIRPAAGSGTEVELVLEAPAS